MRPRRQVHIQRRFLPEQVYLLPAQPVFAFVGESQIKIPQDTCEDDAHLDISQTDHASSALVGRIQQEALREFPRRLRKEIAYFFPMQFLGPIWKGWNTSRLSVANFGSPSHLSGWNSSALAKNFSLWYKA